MDANAGQNGAAAPQKRKRVARKSAAAATPPAVLVVNEFHAPSAELCDGLQEHAHAAKAGPQEHVILQLRTSALASSQDEQDDGEIQGYQEHSNFMSEPSAYSNPHCGPSARSACDGLGADVKVVMPNLVKDEMWPAHVNSACFWCAHTFASTPVGLPVKVGRDGVMHTAGCFCSVECAAAFNFNCSDLGQSRWHSYQLLNRMARKLGHVGAVPQAASRFALKLFGGWLEIDEFRATHHPISALPHPMVPVVQYMEEVVPEDAARTPGAFVPLDAGRVQKAANNILSSARSKKNTIQSKMKLAASAEA